MGKVYSHSVFLNYTNQPMIIAVYYLAFFSVHAFFKILCLSTFFLRVMKFPIAIASFGEALFSIYFQLLDDF